MPIYLRQSTASQEIPLGYFLDSTDGDTAETGLTIANTDIKVWKTGATTLASKNSGGGTHISSGIYYAVLDATDSDTIGPMVLFVHVSGALAIRVECCVLDEAVYDALFGTSAWLDAAGVRSAVGLATANLDTQLTAIDDFIDTEVAAIKTQTDKLTFTVANHLDVNVLKVGGTTQTARDIGASVLLSSGTGTGQVDLTSGAVKIQGGIKKNTALSAYEFAMVDTSGTPRTSLTVTATRSIDGGAFASCANSVSELSAGVYKIDLANTDLNGRVITLRFTATGAQDRLITIVTVD